MVIREPKKSEDEIRFERKVKLTFKSFILAGMFAGGLIGWLDGARSESRANTRMRQEAEGLRKCADYIATEDLTRSSVIRMKSLPAVVREDCGLGSIPLTMSDSLQNEGFGLGLTPGFEDTAMDTVLQYDEVALESEIYRLDRDASDVSMGYSVVTGLGGSAFGGMGGVILGGAGLLASEAIRRRRS